MKMRGTFNRHLSHALALLGHTDETVICDAGLPIPHQPGGPEVVDLALNAGVPSFVDVLDAVLDELVIEYATAAYEVRDDNPHTAALLEERFGYGGLNFIPHENFKKRTRHARLIVRTGEATPYSNVILRSGVPF
ncbi:D-ribose pyranase [Streptomyces boncukensis]|uniref:D-ribose pyranase n=1 Tax=Streptomyces boncukensis TaxID=2711219 RepID=A0A6G4X054_9ACTN|nr:D-ribose pyranase [Streptomyces boncukensis]NGO70633.1 D-ribose pyranase [Streptomyces boncukensis]